MVSLGGRVTRGKLHSAVGVGVEKLLNDTLRLCNCT